MDGVHVHEAHVARRRPAGGVKPEGVAVSATCTVLSPMNTRLLSTRVTRACCRARVPSSCTRGRRYARARAAPPHEWRRDRHARPPPTRLVRGQPPARQSVLWRRRL